MKKKHNLYLTSDAEECWQNLKKLGYNLQALINTFLIYSKELEKNDKQKEGENAKDGKSTKH